MKLKKTTSVSKAVAEWVRDRYRPLWGFVVSRIQKALIADAVLMEVRIQDASVFENKSAQWLADRLEIWTEEAIELLATKFAMRLSD